MSNVITDEFLLKKYPLRGQVHFRDQLITLPLIYKGRGFTCVFPISYKKARELMDLHGVQPVKFLPTKSLLSVTVFDYHKSPVGPYTELAYAIPTFLSVRINLPLLPILFYKFSRKFGFYVIDLLQSTQIAIDHGTLINGYPHNNALVNCTFTNDNNNFSVRVDNNDKEILTIFGSKGESKKRVRESYRTYFKKNSHLSHIEMDVYGLKQKVNGCSLHIGDNKLSNMIRGIDISQKPLMSEYYSDLVEVLIS